MTDAVRNGKFECATIRCFFASNFLSARKKGRSQAMFLKWLRQNRAQRWIWFGAAALVAVQLYYVREMLAALLLFSIGFAVVGSVILLLFLLDRGLYRGLAWTAPYQAHAAL